MHPIRAHDLPGAALWTAGRAAYRIYGSTVLSKPPPFVEKGLDSEEIAGGPKTLSVRSRVEVETGRSDSGHAANGVAWAAVAGSLPGTRRPLPVHSSCRPRNELPPAPDCPHLATNAGFSRRDTECPWTTFALDQPPCSVVPDPGRDLGSVRLRSEVARSGKTPARSPGLSGSGPSLWIAFPGLAPEAVALEKTNSPFLADDNVERGRLLRERKHLEALKSFESALRLHKDHPLAQPLKAEALFHLGRYEEVPPRPRFLDAGRLQRHPAIGADFGAGVPWPSDHRRPLRARGRLVRQE
jgi:hypothetical protein